METILENPPSPRLRHLLTLPNTHEALHELTRLKEKQAHTDVIARQEHRIADCQQRDAIAASRPAGCWCLGTGGRDVSYTAGGMEVIAIPCSCPEGQAAKQRYHEILGSEKEIQERQRIKNLWASAQIPARFMDMRLATSPIALTDPALIERLKYPPDPWIGWPQDDTEPPEEATNAWLSVYDIWVGSWFFYGPFGVGKTGLAIGLAWERVKADDEIQSLRFTTAPAMLSELRSTYNRSKDDEKVPSEQEIIDKYALADLLILDDLGAEQVKNTGWVEDRLYQIIGERHDNLRPTIFTSNLSIAQLAARIGERITWRIVEMVDKNIVYLTGPNLRAG